LLCFMLGTQKVLPLGEGVPPPAGRAGTEGGNMAASSEAGILAVLATPFRLLPLTGQKPPSLGGKEHGPYHESC
ncbi:MAG TPA: hypothetical protein VLZ54_13695, partial [Arenibacter sp.]|nr:hypothetical protein [Arenibacter sp.]